MFMLTFRSLTMPMACLKTHYSKPLRKIHAFYRPGLMIASRDYRCCLVPVPKPGPTMPGVCLLIALLISAINSAMNKRLLIALLISAK